MNWLIKKKKEYPGDLGNHWTMLERNVLAPCTSDLDYYMSVLSLKYH